jgi:hypothetical protein
MLESAPDEICASPYGLGSDPVRTPSTVNALPGSRSVSKKERGQKRLTSSAWGDRSCQAAYSYSWISPPSRSRRLSCGYGGSRRGVGLLSVCSGGRDASERCGRCRL